MHVTHCWGSFGFHPLENSENLLRRFISVLWLVSKLLVAEYVHPHLVPINEHRWCNFILNELIRLPVPLDLSARWKETSVSRCAVPFYWYHMPNVFCSDHANSFMKLSVSYYFMVGLTICVHLYFHSWWPLLWNIKTWRLCLSSSPLCKTKPSYLCRVCTHAQTVSPASSPDGFYSGLSS